MWGEGGARRILLLHGITSSISGWWRVAPDLVDRGWEVTALDLRGHGDSPKPGDYRFDAHVEDVLAFGSGWDAVLGHSMGGTISIMTAAADPGWTSGMVLQDPALMLPEPMSEVMDWLLEEYGLEIDPVRIAAASPRWHPQDVSAKIEALEKSTGDMVAATIEVNWPWMVFEEAARVEAPMVVLGSDPDAGGILPIAFGEWLQATAPCARFEVIPGSSHSAHRDDDQYETYRSTLVEALEQLPTLC